MEKFTIGGLVNYQGFRKYFANTSWMISEKILRMIVTLLVGIYVVRYLGPERLGILSFSMSFVALFQAPAKLGLNGIIVRDAVQAPDARDELLGTAFFLRLAGGAILLGLVYLGIHVSDSDGLTRLLVMIIAFGFIFQSFEVIDFYFQARVWGKLSSIAGMGAMLLSSALKLVFIWCEVSLGWFAILIGVENAARAVVLFWFYHTKELSIHRWRFSLRRARKLLGDSWPLIFSALAIMIYMRIDQVMIKMMLNNTAVGQYSAAVKLSEAFYFLPVVMGKSVFPAILGARERGAKFYHDRLYSFYGIMTWMGLLVALPTSFLSGWVVHLLYGPAYAPAASVLSIHIWAAVFVFMGVASGKYLLAENLQKFTFVLRVSGCICNVTLNFILIPKYEIFGAAVATVLSQCVASYLGYLLSVKTHLNFKYLTYSLLYPFKIRPSS